jgi:hypothetical protein
MLLAQAVAQYFPLQIYGIDYYETYSPVARLTSFRKIIAIAAEKDWDIDSFDFNGLLSVLSPKKSRE